MASAKQIAWRKKFARMSKAGVFRSTKKGKARAKETAQHLGGIRRSRQLDQIEALEDQKSNFISDSVMLKATDEGFQIPSGWYRLTKKQKLGFLKKFWRAQ